MAVTAGAPARFPVTRRMLSWDGESDSGLSLELEGAILSETVFGFLDGSPESRTTEEVKEDDGEEEEEYSAARAEENRAFWETQHTSLKETLCKTSSTEKTIRNATKEAMKRAQEEGQLQLQEQQVVCVCPVKHKVNDVVEARVIRRCKSCTMREISRRLTDRGFDSAVSRSRWRSSPEIPSGEYTFIVVMMKSSNHKKGQVKVIIDPGFRAEFEMARATENYNRLVSRLPMVFVGKVDRLKAIVKIICSAAKKCSEDNKVHMGPWRKQKYMLAKYSININMKN